MIITQSDIPEILKYSKRMYKKIVFTNGVFDIIHAGHVEYLKKCRLYGEILMVGINSDDSVRRLKGPNRPINRLEDRAAVLSSLIMVDYVIPFEDDTPLCLIKMLRPNTLAKGADWAGNIVGSDFVKSYGGKVEAIELKMGYSTTKMIEKIKTAY